MNRFFVLLLSIFISMSVVKSQEVTIDAGADLVSSYVWRGLYVGPVSIQPKISLSSGGFSLGIWGSSSFNSTWREFDLFASYSIGNFTFLITDYYFPQDLPSEEKGTYFDFSEHVLEGTLSFSLGESVPLSFAWSTNFAGDDDYSSYFEASYSIPTSFVEIDLTLGATPSAGIYSDGFALVVAAIKASKELSITENYSIPVYTQAVLNPDSKDVFLVFGMSF